MTDFKASIKIECKFMGKEYKTNMHINYCGDEGVDERITDFFEDMWKDGLARYHAENEEQFRQAAEAMERAEYERLHAKYGDNSR